jgi:GntR family transcriptional regulator/MocR family aminotransferase
MIISGTTFGPELLIELDRSAAEPLHGQLADRLRDAIRTGRLTPRTRLPSTRLLAADLGLSRRLVVDAYSQLAAGRLSAQPPRLGHQGRHSRRGQRARAPRR